MKEIGTKTTLLATAFALLVTGPAHSQQPAATRHCAETLKPLDRELTRLVRQQVPDETAKPVRTTTDREPSQTGLDVPPGRVLAELMNMEALHNHLRCLGTQPNPGDG